MTEQEAAKLAEQVESEMALVNDDYGWTYLSPDDGGAWAVCFFDWPDMLTCPADWEALKRRAESD